MTAKVRIFYKMKRIQFNYHCPEELIAQEPAQKRDESRLLVFEKHKSIEDDFFKNLPTVLSRVFLSQNKNKKILLVCNNSKVYPARLKLFISNGRQCELFLLDVKNKTSCPCLLKPKSKMKQGEIFYLDKTCEHPVFKLTDYDNPTVAALFSEPILEFLDNHGSTPLPPYIKRLDESDKIRYQNIYASHRYTGSSAAPTAGFHFTHGLIENLHQHNIDLNYVTLHVGLGTFLPVKTDAISDHVMHEEKYFISSELIEKIYHYQENKWPIVFVGTTSLRSVESFFRKVREFDPVLKSSSAVALSNQWHVTNLFLYPKDEYDVQRPIIGDALITNFHQPESSLLMLVASLIGYQNLKTIYDHALNQKYRFFSYGDSSLLVF